MDPQTLNKLKTAEESVTQLVEVCTKNSPLYKKSPRTVAQVSRTGKWLINAIKALLMEALPRLARLITALKHHRKQAKAVRAAVQSLRELPPLVP